MRYVPQKDFTTIYYISVYDFVFLNHRSPGFAQLLQLLQPDIRTKETHAGDLVLSGNEVVTIEHAKNAELTERH